MSKRTSLLVVVAFTLVLGSVLLVIAATGFTSVRSRSGQISATVTTFASVTADADDEGLDERDADDRSLDGSVGLERAAEHERLDVDGGTFDED